LHFTEEAEAFLLFSSSSWNKLAAAVVVVVMAKSSAAAFRYCRFTHEIAVCSELF
jgi:uncharacterized membrane protein